jgi:hypothetical protein
LESTYSKRNISQEAKNKAASGQDIDEDAITVDPYELSVSVVSLTIQCLYELNRTQEIMGIVMKFYNHLENIPFDILFMWYVENLSCHILVNAWFNMDDDADFCCHYSINLQISLKKTEKAKELVLEALSRYRRPGARYPISSEQYTSVVSTLIFHILAADGHFAEGFRLLEADEAYVNFQFFSLCFFS